MGAGEWVGGLHMRGWLGCDSEGPKAEGVDRGLCLLQQQHSHPFSIHCGPLSSAHKAQRTEQHCQHQGNEWAEDSILLHPLWHRVPACMPGAQVDRALYNLQNKCERWTKDRAPTPCLAWGACKSSCCTPCGLQNSHCHNAGTPNCLWGSGSRHTVYENGSCGCHNYHNTSHPHAKAVAWGVWPHSPCGCNTACGAS